MWGTFVTCHTIRARNKRAPLRCRAECGARLLRAIPFGHVTNVPHIQPDVSTQGSFSRFSAGNAGKEARPMRSRMTWLTSGLVLASAGFVALSLTRGQEQPV